MKETKKNIESANAVVNQVAAKTAAPTTAKTAKEQPQTAEQLQAEISQQQKEVERKQKELQDKLRELAEKQKLNNNRSKFIDTLDNLAKFEERLREEDSFETSIFRVKFCDAEASYRDNDLFSVSNTSVLLDLIGFMRERINIKVAEIEQQLLK